MVAGDHWPHRPERDWAQRVFADIEDSSGLISFSASDMLYYKTMLHATIEGYQHWLTRLHELIPPPLDVLRPGVSHLTAEVGVSFGMDEHGVCLGWMFTGQNLGKQQEATMYPIMFATKAVGAEKLMVFAARSPPGLPLALEHLAELVFHSIFTYAIDPMQVSRAALWRCGVNWTLTYLRNRNAARRRPTTRRQSLRPCQKEAVEEHLKLVDEGHAPLQQFFARRHGVTDRTLRNWIARYKGER